MLKIGNETDDSAGEIEVVQAVGRLHNEEISSRAEGKVTEIWLTGG